MRRRGIGWLIVLALLVLLIGGLYIGAVIRLPVIYGEKSTLALTPEDPDYESYLQAWQDCASYASACQEAWGGKWPDYYGGFGVVRSEEGYVVSAYLTEDTEANRQAVNQAAGVELKAFTTAAHSWNELTDALSRVDLVSSIPLTAIHGMGIQMETGRVRVYLTHKDPLTMIALSLADFQDRLQLVVVPAKPTVSAAALLEDGTVEISLSGLTYADSYVVEISPDSAFEEYVYTQSFEGNDGNAVLSDFGDYPYDDEEYTDGSWFVRAKSLMEAEDGQYESEWSAVKVVSR